MYATRTPDFLHHAQCSSIRLEQSSVSVSAGMETIAVKCNWSQHRARPRWQGSRQLCTTDQICWKIWFAAVCLQSACLRWQHCHIRGNLSRRTQRRVVETTFFCCLWSSDCGVHIGNVLTCKNNSMRYTFKITAMKASFHVRLLSLNNSDFASCVQWEIFVSADKSQCVGSASHTVHHGNHRWRN